MIELLIVVVIGSVVTGAVLVTWFALGNSYSMTTSSTKARELARDAVARLARELRDAEPKGTYPALRTVTTDEIVFTTTFNDAASDQVNSDPLLTRYWYEWDESTDYGVLHRQRDTDLDGVLVEEDGTPDPDDRDMVIVRHVLNPNLFTYSYIDVGGNIVEEGPPPPDTSLPTIFLVHLSLSVDLNPGTAPLPMDLSTTVQLRNQSRF